MKRSISKLHGFRRDTFRPYGTLRDVSRKKGRILKTDQNIKGKKETNLTGNFYTELSV